jgi:hypothetical protein
MTFGEFLGSKWRGIAVRKRGFTSRPSPLRLGDAVKASLAAEPAAPQSTATKAPEVKWEPKTGNERPLQLASEWGLIFARPRLSVRLACATERMMAYRPLENGDRPSVELIDGTEARLALRRWWTAPA